MIGGARAVFAEKTIDRVTRVSLVGVGLQVALGELEGIFWCELVEGEFAAGLEFAGVAVAEDVRLGVRGELDLPFDGAAVAVAFECIGHFGCWFEAVVGTSGIVLWLEE